MTEPVRTYSSAEEELLARNLLGLTRDIHQGALSDRLVDETLLFDLHARLFGGVRSHYGRCRRQDFGSEHLTFGPNRSVHRSQVPGELERIFQQARRSIASLDDNPDDAAYEVSALHVAIWTHAEIIRVHPFEDGNGRSSRALMNWILVRLGLSPVAIEVPKQEYHDCLNHYHRTRELQPLLDLALALYPVEP